jgi:hypothetical protein
MSKHQIKIDDFDNYTTTYEIAGVYGRGENKTLKVETGILTKSVIFYIYTHNKLVTYKHTLQEAIEVYNSI